LASHLKPRCFWEESKWKRDGTVMEGKLDVSKSYDGQKIAENQTNRWKVIIVRSIQVKIWMICIVPCQTPFWILISFSRMFSSVSDTLDKMVPRYPFQFTQRPRDSKLFPRSEIPLYISTIAIGIACTFPLIPAHIEVIQLNNNKSFSCAL